MAHMEWPPQIKDIQVFGEVKDISGRHYPRDIGRPVYLAGNTYYLFGDTFCHDSSNQFVGVSNNTIAFVPDPQNDPLTCQYMHDDAYQQSFIPHTPSEEEYEKEPKNREDINRVVNWVFGGIIEDFPGSRGGWVFYEKMLTHGSKAGKRFGHGVARVQVQNDNSLKVDRLMGDTMLFGENEPQFGMITHLVEEDGYIYLLGAKDAPSPTLDLKNHWARIRSGSDFTMRGNYEFLVHTLDGKSQVWDHSYSLHQLVNVIAVQGQGAIIKVPELAPKGRPYLWFGNNKFPANKIYIACASRLEGPWEEWEGPEIPKFGGGGLRYTLYPHERNCHAENGEIRISWTDDKQLGGMVIQAMLRFVLKGEDESIDQQMGISSRSDNEWKDKTKSLWSLFR
ncbi:hypothetical protein DSL72_006796 [Monilinia vaccinii-corymbosi]|uniref:DUF4185 domain-containing protein n=1 Tax=Monilinia vaccinii-corymbosi TaxID=61207 RepID=A0A8A3PL38_9HELO|nr:hypothetical protein DSL72_006796 [Monilinia vaccinii-corymbosi]